MNTFTTPRGEILQNALDLTEGDRNRAYGSPLNNLSCFADLVNAYINGIQSDRANLDAVDGAVIMALAKISRIAANKNHADNYTDLTAYGAIAGECARLLAPTLEGF